MHILRGYSEEKSWWSKFQWNLNSQKLLKIKPRWRHPPFQQIYEVKEFNGGFSKHIETLSKKKTELKIESFFELDEKLYAEIILLNDVARKALVFMDGLTKLSKSEKNES